MLWISLFGGGWKRAEVIANEERAEVIANEQHPEQGQQGEEAGAGGGGSRGGGGGGSSAHKFKQDAGKETETVEK